MYGVAPPFSIFILLSPSCSGSTLWRDWSWKTVMERLRDVEQIYNSENKPAVRPLLGKYGVDYVYVGPLEKRKYRSAGLAAFAKSFPLVYRNKGVKIYAVK